MSKLTNSKKKVNAEDLYIRAGLSGKEISEQLDISEQTIVKWKKEGDWERRKQDLLTSPLAIKELLTKEMFAISQGSKSSIDSDALSKLSSTIERMDKKLSPRVVSDVFREFDQWMTENDPKLALEFVRYHKMFLLHRINIEGNGNY